MLGVFIILDCASDSNGSHFLCNCSGIHGKNVCYKILSLFSITSSINLFSHRVWYKVVPMRDFAIKLPASLGPAVQSDERDRTDSGSLPGAEPLLKGDLQLSAGNPSGESSGCSSGTESVASSADTASHMSISDSGTDQPKSPSPSLTEPLEKDITIRQRPNVKKAGKIPFFS